MILIPTLPTPFRLTAELLRLLCAEPQVKEQVKLYEGIPVLLSLLHSDHLKLLWSVVWILVQVCEDPETSVEIRIWGGIKQLLHILRGWVRVGFGLLCPICWSLGTLWRDGRLVCAHLVPFCFGVSLVIHAFRSHLYLSQACSTSMSGAFIF